MKRRTSYFVSALLVALGAASSVNGEEFTYTGNIQTYTVPATGIYAISVSGAQGGTGEQFSGGPVGGLGASVFGDVFLAQGTVLDIAVGGTGANSTSFAGGGGGGSFVYATSAGQPLAVAGGGGGGASIEGTQGGPGQNGTSGQVGFDSPYGGTAGINGSGGGGGTYNNSGLGGNGAGGGGWFGNGGTAVDGPPGGDGPVLFSGGVGEAHGGFGGGGGSGLTGGGGAGGYSGGGGGGGYANGGGGGGGGSYLGSSLTNTVEMAGVNSGNGEVTITQDTPEPGSLALLGVGVVILAARAWWRQFVASFRPAVQDDAPVILAFPSLSRPQATRIRRAA